MLREKVTLMAAHLSNPLRPRRRASFRQAGSSLVEALVGTAIAATGFTAICVASADCLGITRAHREMVVASQCLQQRSEQCTAANWSQITDPASVQAILNQPSVNDKVLDGQTETITVNPYPLVTPSVPPLVVTRDASGTTTVVLPTPGASLRSFLAVRVDFQESWTSAQGHRTRTRATSTIISLGGLLQ